MNYKFFIIAKKIEPFYQEAIEEYFKRLQRFCSVSLSICKNSKKLPVKDLEKSYKILITPQGKTISSEKFALKIKDLEMKSITDITFLIGEGIEIFDEIFTISQMKMSKGLIATLLAEQLYRAYKILRNEPYHK